MKLELNDIHTLIGWVAEKGLSLLEYEDAGMKIRIGGAGYGNHCSGVMPVENQGPGSGRREAYVENAGESSQPYGEEMPVENGRSCGAVSAADSTDPGAVQDASRTAGQESSVNQEDTAAVQTVESPLVGTFFAAPAEDAEPYVRVGDTVKCGQVLGIVEAMKLMNEIEADCDGVVEEILVKNEQMVEYGQPLMKIRRSK